MNIQNLNDKTVRGYISSRDVGRYYFPQKIQNLVILDYAEKKKLNLQLSGTEWIIKDSYLMLKSLIKEKNVDGILFFSIFQLLDKKNFFEKIVKEIIRMNKNIFFALEDLKIMNDRDIQNILELIKIEKFSSLRDFDYLKKKIIKKL